MNNLQSIASLERKLAVCWSGVGNGRFYSGLALEKPLNFRFFSCEGERLLFPCPSFLRYCEHLKRKQMCQSLGVMQVEAPNRCLTELSTMSYPANIFSVLIKRRKF